ncbi:AAA family ATPase [Clostridium botulinum]|nr:AAA family ATPase [Clostridium botulinum]NFI53318.1 AAA family ATPase [Clostridium botulinum]NFO39231.1 AAA family ATPase [Clostridium botulinum]NFQ40149.1 AAA family ATPase [Clostridium botulinum]
MVFGDGIGLQPKGYDWMASIELLVNLDSITASLSMRKYPKKNTKPCCVRCEQGKYFNSTFISCKDKDGNFTDIYMKDYFKYFDNRPYHDVIKVLGEASVETDVDNEKEYSVQELGDILKNMYDNAEKNMQVASIHIFGIKYGEKIISSDYKAPDIIKAALLNESYATELNKAINIYKCLQSNRYGIRMKDINNVKENNLINNQTNRVLGGTNILLYGVPGAGKSHEIKKEYCSDERYMERVVFHPDYTYSDFVGQVLPRVIDEKLKYIFTPGPFTKMLKKAENDPGNKYYLVIEEINRGNAPAIFGEIFQLLDRKEDDNKYDSSEIGESEYGISNYEVANEVYGNPEHQVKIPSNMYVLATMNTADQNVFTLDTAFQRRWNMKQIRNIVSKEQASNMIEGTNVNWGAFVSVINDLVININSDIVSSEDKRLGAYFIKKKEFKVDKFPEKVLKYLWDDAFKMDKYSIFKDQYKSLEDIVNAYETAKGDKLEMVLKEQIYKKMLSKMNDQKEMVDNENTADE